MASNDFVISTDLIVLGGVDFSGGSGSGSILAANAQGFAVLDEAALEANPTLIPRRADLTTGIGGADAEGNSVLSLVVEGSKKLDLSDAAATWFSLANGMAFNMRVIVSGLADVLQFVVQGHSTQTSNIFVVEQNDGTDLFTINNAGLATLNGNLVVGATNPAQSGSIRLPNAGDIIFRNSANSADLSALSIGPTNFLEIGLSGTPWPTITAYTSFFWVSGGRQRITVDSTTALEVQSATPVAVIFKVDTVNDEVTIAGTVQGTLSGSFALLNEASTDNNPTLIPRRADLTTGIGGQDNEGSASLDLIVGGVKKLGLSPTQANWFVTQMNLSGAILVNGTTDVLQMRVQGHSTQTGAILTVEQSDGTDLFTVDNDGLVSILVGSLRAAAASGHAFGSPATNSVLTIDTTSTANGGGTNAAAVNFFPDYTGASGITEFLNLMRLAGNIQTQAVAEVIANVSTLAVDEPAISIGAGSSITNAQTFLIEDAPTEGASNFAMRVVSGLSQFGGDVQGSIGGSYALLNEAATAINPTVAPNRLLLGTGISAVDNEGAGTFHIVVDDTSLMNLGADQVNINSVLTTTAGALFVDGNADNIQMRIDAHSTQTSLLFRIRDTASAIIFSVANSGDTLIAGDLTVSGAGPHAIAGTPSGIIGLIISETFTSDGSSTLASGVFITQTLVGASGDTTSLTGTTFISAITTQTETESIANISQVEINEPFISDNLTGDITNAQTLLIVNAPTEGLANYALRVVSGATFLGGELEHAGSTLGFFGTSPTTQPAAYTRNATIVEDRTLLASASATALNNNNVLAALIADLQSLGVIG